MDDIGIVVPRYLKIVSDPQSYFERDICDEYKKLFNIKLITSKDHDPIELTLLLTDYENNQKIEVTSNNLKYVNLLLDVRRKKAKEILDKLNE